MSDPIEPSLEAVLRSIPDPRLGLPDSVFEFVIKVTTMINVDLLIKDPARGTLLTWREDDFGIGWHIPGGIIRYYEPIEHRIGEVARLELGANVEPDAFPYDIQQFFRRRGHFISLLYRCRLTSPFADRSMLHPGGVPRDGAIGWFTDPPDRIYPGHEVYSRHVGSSPAVPPTEG